MYDYDRTHRIAAGKPALDPEKRKLVEKQLAEYGYRLSDSNEIMKGDKNLKVVVSAKGPRIYVKQPTGAALWSGADVGDFVAKFWFAKKV